MTACFIPADPYPWLYHGDLRRENTALLVVDMQSDFCGIGGYVDTMGYDPSYPRADRAAAARAAGDAFARLPRAAHPRGAPPRAR